MYLLHNVRDEALKAQLASSRKKKSGTHSRFNLVQLQASGQPPLRQKANLGDDELIDLRAIRSEPRRWESQLHNNNNDNIPRAEPNAFRG